MKHALPNIGLLGGFVDEQDEWGADMNGNLAVLSVLVQAGVLGRVAAVPTSPAPAQGDIYILTAAPNAQKIAYYDDGKWSYITPAKGWSVYDRGVSKRLDFNGAAWEERSAGGIEEAPKDGKAYERKDGAWAVATAGSSGGSGGGEEEDPSTLPIRTPVLVQKATLRNDGTIALPAAPTVGNTMVAILAGYAVSLSAYIPTGFTEVQRYTSDMNNGVLVAIKEVRDAESGSYSISANDNQQAVLYEISGFSSVVGLAGGALATSGNAFSIPVPDRIKPNLVIAAVEADGTTIASITTDDNVFEDYKATDGGNHRGAIARTTLDFVGNVQGSFDAAPAAPVYGVFSIEGRPEGQPNYEYGRRRMGGRGWRVRFLTAPGNGGVSEQQITNAILRDEAGNNIGNGGIGINSGGADQGNPFSGGFWRSLNNRGFLGIGEWFGVIMPEPIAPFSFGFLCYYENGCGESFQLEWSVDGYTNWQVHSTYFRKAWPDRNAQMPSFPIGLK